jgi:hypothetical protein
LAVRTVLAVLVLALVPSACGGGSESAGTAPTTSPPTTTTNAPPPERFGYIRSVSAAGPTTTLAFDEAEFLKGQEAQQAAEKDGVVSPGEHVPNDYYIRNADKSTMTYPIANDAKITARRCSLCRHGKPGELGPFLASFMQGRQTYADPYRGKYSPYWLTIEGGQVVAIDEQYVP